MRVCDEGWGREPCPALHGASEEGQEWLYCALGMWSGYNFHGVGGDEPPDSCPHAAALRAVVENPELVLVAIPPAIPSVQMAISALLNGADVYHTVDYRDDGETDVWRVEKER